MSINESDFGKTKNNIEVKLYTIKNKNNLEIKIINYGGAIVSIKTPDKLGKLDDIVLGYDNISSYEKGDKFFGAMYFIHQLGTKKALKSQPSAYGKNGI